MWTARRLRRLRSGLAWGLSLEEIKAEDFPTSSVGEIDLACWARFVRSEAEALEVLNSSAAKGAEGVKSILRAG